MKKTIKFRVLAIVSLFMLSMTALAENDKPITKNQLPKTAQQIINKNFADKKIAMMTTEPGFLDKSYDVVFADGDKIEFDRKGQWTSISCPQTLVPTVLIPLQIANYLKETYPNEKVKKIERDNKQYEVELTNRLEITFNNKFQVIEIDD